MDPAKILLYAQAARAAAPLAQIGLQLTKGIAGAVTGKPVTVPNYSQYVQPAVLPPPPPQNNLSMPLLIGGAVLLILMMKK